MKYKSKNHSKFSIKYHIIFVCKYRKKLLVKLGEDIKDILLKISHKYDFEITCIEVDEDHVHMLVESNPTLSPLNIVRLLKQQSTFTIWKRYSLYLLKHFWNEKTFWIDGYFVSTIGGVSEKILKKYIDNQG